MIMQVISFFLYYFTLKHLDFFHLDQTVNMDSQHSLINNQCFYFLFDDEIL